MRSKIFDCAADRLTHQKSRSFIEYSHNLIISEMSRVLVVLSPSKMTRCGKIINFNKNSHVGEPEINIRTKERLFNYCYLIVYINI